MKHVVFFLLFIFAISNCGRSTKAGSCDPLSQKMIKGTQYISNEVLNEEGNWDYEQWTKYYLKTKRHMPVYECIPIEDALSLEEKIQEQNRIVDLKR